MVVTSEVFSLSCDTYCTYPAHIVYSCIVPSELADYSPVKIGYISAFTD